MALGPNLTVSEAAAIVGRSASALRQWERIGIIPPARRDAMSGWRVYTPAEVRTIRLIADKGRRTP